jgi:hypothetical protein
VQWGSQAQGIQKNQVLRRKQCGRGYFRFLHPLCIIIYTLLRCANKRFLMLIRSCLHQVELQIYNLCTDLSTPIVFQVFCIYSSYLRPSIKPCIPIPAIKPIKSTHISTYAVISASNQNPNNAPPLRFPFPLPFPHVNPFPSQTIDVDFEDRC